MPLWGPEMAPPKEAILGPECEGLPPPPNPPFRPAGFGDELRAHDCLGTHPFRAPPSGGGGRKGWAGPGGVSLGAFPGSVQEANGGAVCASYLPVRFRHTQDARMASEDAPLDLKCAL